MKDLTLQKLVSSLKPVLAFMRRYAVLAFIVIVIGLYGFLVFRINTLVVTDPSEDAISEKLQTVKRPKIDQSAVDKIQQLQDQNLEVKSLFDQARNNPFSE